MSSGIEDARFRIWSCKFGLSQTGDNPMHPRRPRHMEGVSRDYGAPFAKYGIQGLRPS